MKADYVTNLQRVVDEALMRSLDDARALLEASDRPLRERELRIVYLIKQIHDTRMDKEN